MALVGVELHFAVGQRADGLAVLANVGDQHHRGMAVHELPGVDDGKRTETLGKADLILLAQVLVAQEDDEALVPCRQNLRKCSVVNVSAQVDIDDLRAQCL